MYCVAYSGPPVAPGRSRQSAAAGRRRGGRRRTEPARTTAGRPPPHRSPHRRRRIHSAPSSSDDRARTTSRCARRRASPPDARRAAARAARRRARPSFGVDHTSARRRARYARGPRVQPRIGHLEIGAANEHDRDAVPSELPPRRTSAVRRYTPGARTARCDERRIVPAGPRALRVPSGLALRSGHPQIDGGVSLRIECGIAHHDRGAARCHPATRRREWRSQSDPARKRQPSHRLPPERIVRTIGRRQHHPPAPRGFAGEDHRASLAVALHRDERTRRPAGAAAHREDATRRGAGRRARTSPPAPERRPSSGSCPRAWGRAA